MCWSSLLRAALSSCSEPAITLHRGARPSSLWLLLLCRTGSRCAGFSSCSRWAQRCSLQALQCRRSSWGAFGLVESSQSRNCVLAGRSIHCTTREVSILTAVHCLFSLLFCKFCKDFGFSFIPQRITDYLKMATPGCTCRMEEYIYQVSLTLGTSSYR